MSPDHVATAPLSSGAVARIFGVDRKTVTRWADEGKLRSFRTPGGQRRFHQADVDTFLQEQAS